MTMLISDRSKEDTMAAQYKQDLCNKSFIHQYQGKCDEKDTLQKRTKFWFNVVYMGGPIPDNVFDCDFNDGMEKICSRCSDISWK